MGIASGSCSTGLGRDLVNPLDSLAKTFWVCAALEGRGTVVTSFTPMASTASASPALASPVSRHPRIDHDGRCDTDVQQQRPRQRFAPLFVFKKDISVCCHAHPAAGSRYSRW